MWSGHRNTLRYNELSHKSLLVMTNLQITKVKNYSQNQILSKMHKQEPKFDEDAKIKV